MEGVSWFTYEVMKEMVLKHPEHEFHFFFDRPYSKKFLFASNVIPHVVPPPARHRVLWDIYFNYTLPWAIKRAKCDVLLSPDAFLCPSLGIPTVLIMHDLAFEHFPEHVGKKLYHYYSTKFKRNAILADAIFAVSEATKQDIIDSYGIDPRKIGVAYNGASEEMRDYSSVTDEFLPTELQGEPYFLFLSAIQPRKNLGKLMLAFDQLKQKHHIPHKLIVAGGHTWIQEEIENIHASLQYQKDVHFTGHITRPTLKALLKHAEALCYVSLFEGFGIPILEAMWAETPIICSNISSMPEVAGDAAIQVDPNSIEHIQAGMEELLFSEGKQEELIQAGKEQRQKFSWNTSSEAIFSKLLAVAKTR